MADRTEVVRLRQGAYELEVCPGHGGCITAFRHRGRDLLRPASARYFAAGDAQEASSFPLVPFSNRVADARFGFRGRTYQLAGNSLPEPHAIHGDGWQSPWTVAAVARHRVVLDLAHRTAGTPLDYRARQTLALGDRGLAATIEIANAGPHPMPAGLGFHPYFVRSEGVDAHRTPRSRLAAGRAQDPAAARGAAGGLGLCARPAPRRARSRPLLRRLGRRGAGSTGRKPI